MKVSYKAFAAEFEKIAEATLKERAKEYYKHMALNLGQAAKDVRYFYDHPDADKMGPPGSAKHIASSITQRIPNLASDLYYSALPPQLHHTDKELKEFHGKKSAKDYFLEGYNP